MGNEGLGWDPVLTATGWGADPKDYLKIVKFCENLHKDANNDKATGITFSGFIITMGTG